jgi:hypothetical protein
LKIWQNAFYTRNGTGKDESVWADFNERLKENEFEVVVDDSEEVRELVEWLGNI